MTERTLILVKPDGVERGLTGQVLARVEARGFRLAELKKLDATREILEQHYAEHQGKPFFEPLVEFMMSGPVVAAVFEGESVIESFRAMAGVSDPVKAAAADGPGGDLARDWGEKVQKNIVHGSDSSESAEREIGIWFA